jgi:hypothetical protein
MDERGQLDAALAEIVAALNDEGLERCRRRRS